MNFNKLIASCFLLFYFSPSWSQPNDILSSGEIELALKKLNTVGSVLYIAAHPDDENTRLLSYFANEKLLRTGYLSITRGDGGQNLVGKEQGELLGLIRTQELLAARRIDGAEQFFTRANDFGYSKNPEETFSIWDHEKVLADVVWVIRTFKPDIIIARFPSTGEGGHGHHTASGILAGEAFKAAGDPKRFSEQLNYTETWQPGSLWWNTFNFGNNNTQREGQYNFDAGMFNPMLGKWYGEIAAESRSQHRSQGFGVPRGRGKQQEYFKPLDGDTSCKNIYCNLDFSWDRIKGCEKFARLIQKAISGFNPSRPSDIIPLLTEAKRELATIDHEHWRKQKTKELDRVILSCAGLWFEATAMDYYVVPSDSLRIKFQSVKYTDTNVILKEIHVTGSYDTTAVKTLAVNESFVVDTKIKTPSTLDLTMPYWLKEEHNAGMYVVDKQMLAGQPENDAALQAVFIFSIGTANFELTTPVVYKWTDPVKGEIYRPLEVRPAVAINFTDHIMLFGNNAIKKTILTVIPQKDSLTGNIILSANSAFIIEPDTFAVKLPKKGIESKFEVTISPGQSGQTKESYVLSDIKSKFVSDDKNYSSANSITEIKYEHIPYQTTFPPSKARLVSSGIITKKKNIGYIEGAGDDIPASLRQLGYNVTVLTQNILENESLNNYDAIITGIRAYNTDERLLQHYNKLMKYVESGGNLIVQYNTNNFTAGFSGMIGPYPFKISRDRITDENAPVSMLNVNHTLLNYPNKISERDFEGWVQERGLYFPSEVNEKYETIIAFNDKDEKPLNNSILFAKHGKGNFIYTGLSFFRQLPAGIPGAYRLFANMIEAPAH